MGGVALGGAVVGVSALGGLGIGLLLGIGGMAIGGVAYGGGALGFIALGGGAVGYYAFGGGVWAVHGLGGNAQDPEARAFFLPWAGPWLYWASLVCMAAPPCLIFLGYLIAAMVGRRRRGV